MWRAFFCILSTLVVMKWGMVATLVLIDVVEMRLIDVWLNLESLELFRLSIARIEDGSDDFWSTFESCDFGDWFELLDWLIDWCLNALMLELEKRLEELLWKKGLMVWWQKKRRREWVEEPTFYRYCDLLSTLLIMLIATCVGSVYCSSRIMRMCGVWCVNLNINSCFPEAPPRVGPPSQCTIPSASAHVPTESRSVVSSQWDCCLSEKNSAFW